jgi:hypothetical protein
MKLGDHRQTMICHMRILALVNIAPKCIQSDCLKVGLMMNRKITMSAITPFDIWVSENKVREGIYLYHWYKERGANDRALQSLRFALTWSRLTKRAPDLGQAVANDDNDDVAPSG